MFLELFPEGGRQHRIVQDVEIGIVRRDVVVFPALVPPTEANDRRPAPGKKILQSRPRPIRCFHFSIVTVAAKLRHDDRFVGRELR